MGFEIDTRGVLYGVSLQKRELRTWRNRLFKYDEAMTSAEEIAGIEGPDPSDVISFFRPRLEFHLTRDDRLIWMNTPKYEFRVLDRSGREIRRIVKDFRPLRITAEDAEVGPGAPGASRPSQDQVRIPGRISARRHSWPMKRVGSLLRRMKTTAAAGSGGTPLMSMGDSSRGSFSLRTK